jgi:hypothetical protein
MTDTQTQQRDEALVPYIIIEYRDGTSTMLQMESVDAVSAMVDTLDSDASVRSAGLIYERPGQTTFSSLPGGHVISIDIESYGVNDNFLDRRSRPLMPIRVSFFDIGEAAADAYFFGAAYAPTKRSLLDRAMTKVAVGIDRSVDFIETVSSPRQWSRSLRRAALVLAPIALPVWAVVMVVGGGLVTLADAIRISVWQLKEDGSPFDDWWNALSESYR